MIYVLSKLANNQCYTKWAKGANDINRIAESVEIKGGADVINKKTLDTPNGVITEITKEQLDILLQIPDFNAHVEKGFITWFDTNNKPAEEKVKKQTEKMPKDTSRQKTPKDYKTAKGKAKPVKKDDEEDEE